MNELNLIGESGTKSIANVTSAGTASERAYIGEAEAKRIALAHAGVNEGDIYDYEFEMDYEHGAMIYELEFDCAGCEYEYDINAKTGEIIKFEADRRGSVSPSPGARRSDRARIHPHPFIHPQARRQCRKRIHRRIKGKADRPCPRGRKRRQHTRI